MPFASVVHVQLTGAGGPAGGEQMLREQLIPRLKAQSGFQSARFFRTPDGTTGMGVAVFPPEAPPVISSAVYEMIIEV